MKPLVERYLGSLPALRRTETWKDIGMKPVRGVVEKTVRKGVEPKGQAAVIFTGPFQFVRPQRVAIRAMALVLETRLRATLREELSGTYSVNVSANYGKAPEERYSLGITFGCAPDRTPELLKAVFQEVERMKTDGPTEQQVNDVKEALLREFETNSKQNPYLLGQISLRYQYPEDLGEFFSLADYYKTVTGTMIQDAARRYLDAANYVQVTLLPEATK
jgi:zinc protease